jgi:hypothetical protein
LPGGLPKNERFEADPLQINPDRRNDDFFDSDQPDSWFEKAKKLIEDINQENDRKEEENKGGDHQGASCSIGDRDDYSPPEASGSDGDASEPQDGVDSQNTSSSYSDEELKINPGKQEKHISGKNNYRPERSELTHPDPQSLVDKFTGKGQPIPNGKKYGQPGFKERVDFGETIGKYSDKSVIGPRPDTTNGIIIYSKTGTHIIPSQPNQ